MEFGWNPAKREWTLRERGVDFAGLGDAFEDPYRLIREDSRKPYGEPRFNLLGMRNGRLYHITYTPRGEVIWIISACKANKRERRRYEEG
jgi:uncharacterized DUF497 family protein